MKILPLCLLLLLLVAVPLALLHRFDRRRMRRWARVVGTTLSVLAMVAATLHFVFLWNKLWLSFVWLLLAGAVATYATARKRWIAVLTYVSITVVSLAVGFSVLLLLSWPLTAARLVPLVALLMTGAMVACRQGLRTYAHLRRSHLKLHEFLTGNGATPAEAMRPFLSKALANAFLPTTPRLLTMSLTVVPALLGGLLMGGMSPVEATMLTVVVLLSVLCCSMLSVLLTIYLYEKLH